MTSVLSFLLLDLGPHSLIIRPLTRCRVFPRKFPPYLIGFCSCQHRFAMDRAFPLHLVQVKLVVLLIPGRGLVLLSFFSCELLSVADSSSISPFRGCRQGIGPPITIICGLTSFDFQPSPIPFHIRSSLPLLLSSQFFSLFKARLGYSPHFHHAVR